MAAAVLECKCMVVHVMVVFSKTSCLTRDWHDLLAAFQYAPSGNLANLVFFNSEPSFCNIHMIQSSIGVLFYQMSCLDYSFWPNIMYCWKDGVFLSDMSKL
jgi:hypothetical protein